MHRTFFLSPLLLFLWKECSRNLLAIKPASPFCPQFMPDHNWWKARLNYIINCLFSFVVCHLCECHLSKLQLLKLLALKDWEEYVGSGNLSGSKSVDIQEIFWGGFLGAGNAQFQSLSNLSLFLRWRWGPCQQRRALTELLTVHGNLHAGTIKSIMSSSIGLTFDLECKIPFELLKQAVDFLWELLWVIKRDFLAQKETAEDCSKGGDWKGGRLLVTSRKHSLGTNILNSFFNVCGTERRAQLYIWGMRMTVSA